MRGLVGMIVLSLSLGTAASARAQTAGATVAQPTPTPQPQVVYAQPQAQPQVVYVQQPYAPGQPAPTGTPQTRSRPNLGLIIPGAILLGVGWIANFIVGLPAGDDPFSSGSTEEWDAFRFSSLVPIAGPWIQLAVKPTDFRQDYWGVWLIFDGLLQAAGTLMLVIGIATPGEETVYADAGSGFSIAIAPSVGPDHAALGITGTF